MPRATCFAARGSNQLQQKYCSSQGSLGKFASQEISVCRISLVAVFLWCLSALGYCQISSGNVFGGYSHLNANGLASLTGTGMNGFEGSAEGKIFPFVSLVGDFSWTFSGRPASISVPLCVVPPGGLPGGCLSAPSPSSVSESTFLFGPRASFRIKEFRPFVHALFGGAHVNESAFGATGSSTAFASAFGGGLDYRLTKRFSWRIQVDAVQTRFFSAGQTNARISTGVVVRF
jgi:hypothetical protein